MSRNKGISTILATKCRVVEIPFLLSRKQINRPVQQGLRIQINGFICWVEATDELSTCEDSSIAVNGTELNSEKG